MFYTNFTIKMGCYLLIRQYLWATYFPENFQTKISGKFPSLRLMPPPWMVPVKYFGCFYQRLQTFQTNLYNVPCIVCATRTQHSPQARYIEAYASTFSFRIINGWNALDEDTVAAVRTTTMSFWILPTMLCLGTDQVGYQICRQNTEHQRCHWKLNIKQNLNLSYTWLWVYSLPLYRLTLRRYINGITYLLTYLHAGKNL